jgi:hypothetical protein
MRPETTGFSPTKEKQHRIADIKKTPDPKAEGKA